MRIVNVHRGWRINRPDIMDMMDTEKQPKHGVSKEKGGRNEFVWHVAFQKFTNCQSPYAYGSDLYTFYKNFTFCPSPSFKISS